MDVGAESREQYEVTRTRDADWDDGMCWENRTDRDYPSSTQMPTDFRRHLN